MPWTPKQFRFLMSRGSPLTAAQKEKDKAEAHADPSLVHHKKGSNLAAALKAAK
jgi:hypothetical protein